MDNDGSRSLALWDETAERILLSAVHHYSPLVRQVQQYGESLEDVVQHLRVRIWRRHPNYSSRYRLSTFVYYYARYELMKWLEYLSRQRRVGWSHRVSLDGLYEECGFLPIATTDSDPENELAYRELLHDLRIHLLTMFSPHEVDQFLLWAQGGADPHPSSYQQHRIRSAARAFLRDYLFNEADDSGDVVS